MNFFDGMKSAADNIGSAVGGTFDAAGGGKSYTEHEYNMAAEGLQGQIRGQKVLQLEYDLQKERVVTRDKHTQVQVAEAKLQQTQYKLTGQQYKTEAERYRSLQSQYEQFRAELDYQSAGNQYEAAKISANLEYQLLAEGLRSLNLQLGEKMAVNDNRNAEFQLRGVLQSTGQNTSFSSLVSGK